MRKAYELIEEDGRRSFLIVTSIKESLSIRKFDTDKIGELRVDQFEDEEECKIMREELIAQALEDGYEENPDFNFYDQVYMDDPDIGLLPVTCHPEFLEKFTDNFYYDISEEYSPFGSDEGADALVYLEELIVEGGDIDYERLPQLIVEDYFALEYIPVDSLEVADIERERDVNEIDMIQSDIITYSLAFGQVKLTGKLDEGLKDLGLASLKRFIIYEEDIEGGEVNNNLRKMLEDLENFE